MNQKNQDTRWLQRFENYEKAFALLREVMEMGDLKRLSDLEKEGLVKRFEFTLELGWKTLKDKMQEDGIVFEQVSPKPVLKLAYQSKYIDDIELWLKMINDSNLMSHIYDFATFDKIITAIQNTYFSELEKLYFYFKEEQGS